MVKLGQSQREIADEAAQREVQVGPAGLRHRSGTIAAIVVACAACGGGGGGTGNAGGGAPADDYFGLANGACFVYSAGAVTYYLGVKGPDTDTLSGHRLWHADLNANGFERRTELWESTAAALLLVRRDDSSLGAMVSSSYEPGVPIALSPSDQGGHVETQATVTTASTPRPVQFDLDVLLTPAPLVFGALTVQGFESDVTGDDAGALALERRWLVPHSGFVQLDLGPPDLPTLTLTERRLLETGKSCAPAN